MAKYESFIDENIEDLDVIKNRLFALQDDLNTEAGTDQQACKE